MITRAQAEALLTLAESLEACERLGIAARLSPVAVPLFIGSYSGRLTVDAKGLRDFVQSVVPKQD